MRAPTVRMQCVYVIISMSSVDENEEQLRNMQASHHANIQIGDSGKKKFTCSGTL